MNKLKTILRAYRDHVIQIDLYEDEHNDMPWIEHDGHGVVITRAEAQKQINCAGSDIRRMSASTFYDFKASLALAKRDGWGLGEEQVQKLRAKLGRIQTDAEALAAAVESDFQYCKDFATGQRSWVGYRVTSITPADAVLDVDSLWGIDDIEYAISEALAAGRSAIDARLA